MDDADPDIISVRLRSMSGSSGRRTMYAPYMPVSSLYSYLVLIEPNMSFYDAL